MESEAETINKNLTKLGEDIALIKDFLMPEINLTDWAEKELAQARKLPRSKYVPVEDIEKRILKNEP